MNQVLSLKFFNGPSAKTCVPQVQEEKKPVSRPYTADLELGL